MANQVSFFFYFFAYLSCFFVIVLNSEVSSRLRSASDGAPNKAPCIIQLFIRILRLLSCPMKKSFPGIEETQFKELRSEEMPKPNCKLSDFSFLSKFTANSKSNASNVSKTFKLVVIWNEFLESKENAEYLRAYFGKLLDRVFLYLHAMLYYQLFCCRD